jgi:hypothetical protein
LTEPFSHVISVTEDGSKDRVFPSDGKPPAEFRPDMTPLSRLPDTMAAADAPPLDG